MKRFGVVAEMFCLGNAHDHLSLVRLGGDAFMPDQTRLEAYIASKAIEKNTVCRSVEDLIAKLSAIGANKCLFNTFEGDRPVSNASMHFERVNATLSVSPTCSLWSASDDWSVEDRDADRNAYGRCCDTEYQVRAARITEYPSILNLAMSVVTNESRRSVIEFVQQRLIEALTGLDGSLTVSGAFGVAQQPGKQFPEPQDMYPLAVMTFASSPKSLTKVGSRWSGLYPILFGRLESCMELESALRRFELESDATRVYPVSKSLGVLHLSDDVISHPAASDESVPWLLGITIDPDEMSMNDGRLAVGKRSYYTMRRYNQLVQLGFFKGRSDSLIWLPVIRESHCALLGLSMDDMLVDFTYPQRAFEEELIIREMLEEFGDALPIKQRLWLAYRSAWSRRFIQPETEFVDYMRTRYFDGVDD